MRQARKHTSNLHNPSLLDAMGGPVRTSAKLQHQPVKVSSPFRALTALLLASNAVPSIHRTYNTASAWYGRRVSSRMSACPLGDCPLSDSGQKQDKSPTTIIDGASQFFDRVESQLMESAGVAQPFAVSAIETAIDSLLRATCEEIGSLKVKVSAKSSASLLLQGQLVGGSVEASSIYAYGFRASQLELSSDGMDIDIGSPIDVRPPNLRSPARVSFKVRLTQDDITRSPVLFAALQAILTELVQTGVSAAIQETLPPGSLRVQLVSVKSLMDGRLVLEADGEITQSDGSVRSLQGFKVRTRPRPSPDMLILDLPELISTFSGFGTKLEFGLPFMRAAGVPLPSGVTLSSLTIDDGVAVCEGHIDVQPLDYDLALTQLQDLAAAAAAASEQDRSSAAQSPNAVPVDREDAIDVETSNGDAEFRSLPPGESKRM